jgi:putative ABC transport system permease protein
MTTVFRKLRWFLSRQRKEDELREELEFHLAEEAEERRAIGLDAEQARYAARRDFGNAALVAEDTRATWGWLLVEQLLQDVRYAFRMVVRTPMLTFLVVLTLALGIGLTTAMFTVVRGVALRPLPFEHADRLLVIHTRLSTGEIEPAVSPPNVMSLLEEDSTAFVHLGSALGIGATLTGAGEARRVDVARVSAAFFDVMRAAPILGRTFDPSENEPGRSRVAIIGHALWQQLGGGADVIGRSVVLNAIPHSIVGVMAQGFDFPNACSVWIPQTYGDNYFSGTSVEGRRNNAFVMVVGRLRPGATLVSARAELDVFAHRLAERFPETNTDVGFIPVPLQTALVADAVTPLWLLLGAAGFVLLIAAANVAGLLLARGTSRREEIAVRSALGASRERIVRQLITESLLLGAGGGALGFILSLWVMSAIAAAQAERLQRISMGDAIRVDVAVLAFALAITVMTAVLAGLVPARRAAADGMATLRETGRRSSGSARGQRLRHSLVVAELALAVVLLHGAGLLLNSFSRLMQVDPGFETEDALAFSLDLPRTNYGSPDRIHAFYRDLIATLHQQPGVRSVGAISRLPIRMPGSFSSRFQFEDRTWSGKEEPAISARIVTPNYFQAMGMTVIQGREIEERDGPAAPAVVVINQAAVARFFPGEHPIGHRLANFSYDPLEEAADAYTIVGIVRDVRSRELGSAPEPQAYFSHAQVPLAQMSIVVRAAGDPMVHSAGIRRAIAALDGNVAMPAFRTFDQILSESLDRPRFFTTLAGAFSAIALLLAAVGLFGLVSFAAAQRTREFGVRIALGASPRELLASIVRDALALVAIGLVLGSSGALLLTGLLEGLLYGVTAGDPTTFAAVAATLAIAALVATAVPAWRAASVHPLTSLRAE